MDGRNTWQDFYFLNPLDFPPLILHTYNEINNNIISGHKLNLFKLKLLTRACG
uniref:Uncharacterized protein n=1 Tax=Anguilla anguilla TaxID=7936 RepID=A0A0E9QER6_ANGAN